ncbi:MAG: signal peptidase II [Lentisphaeria bacterium]|nr:signal peptidase II [Lentisphaeria bacterium]
MNWLERIEKKSHREKKVFFQALALGLILLIIDQITKWYIVKNFNLFESIPVIDGWFNITSVRNLGAAWSILSGHVWLLLVFGLLAGIGIIIFFRKLAEGCVERYFALMLILSGIFGNSFDRAFHGEVVDFIHVHYYEIWHYPVFNVADMAICTGVGIYLLSGFLRKNPEKEAEKC